MGTPGNGRLSWHDVRQWLAIVRRLQWQALRQWVRDVLRFTNMGGEMLAIMLALQLGAVGSHQIPVAVSETLHVEVSGVPGGAPVVLVPGFAGSAYAFRHVARILADDGARIIVVEPLAIGTSSRPRKSDYSITAQAARLAAVMDSLRVSGAVVVGQGINATTAVRLALARPELVQRLVLIEGGGADRAAGPGLRRAADLLAAGGKVFLSYGRMRDALRDGMVDASGDPSWVTDNVVDAYLIGVRTDKNGSIDALVRTARSREPDRIAERLHELAVPVVLLLGGATHKSGPSAREVQLLQRGIAGIEVRTVPGAGHHLAEEAPAEVVAAVGATRPGEGGNLVLGERGTR